MTEGAGQALGIVTLLGDFGLAMPTVALADAGAAIGIVRRAGLGKLMHLNVRYRWLQDRLKSSQMELCEAHGLENPADMVTENVSQVLLAKYLEAVGRRGVPEGLRQHPCWEPSVGRATRRSGS